MERLFLNLSFVAMGWIPFLIGGVLVVREDYIVGGICFLMAVSGFRQMVIETQAINNKKQLEYQQRQLVNLSQQLEIKRKELERLRNYYENY
jgi:hypothetical protein